MEGTAAGNAVASDASRRCIAKWRLSIPKVIQSMRLITRKSQTENDRRFVGRARSWSAEQRPAQSPLDAGGERYRESLDRDMSPGYAVVMKPSEALALHRERIRAIVAHYGGVNPRVFGSVARGEDTEESDLDILVDDPEGHRLNLFALGGMNYDISSLIGRPVDVVPSADLPQRMRATAYAEAMPL